jgi:hypothetical protein
MRESFLSSVPKPSSATNILVKPFPQHPNQDNIKLRNGHIGGRLEDDEDDSDKMDDVGNEGVRVLGVTESNSEFSSPVGIRQSVELARKEIQT